MLLTNEKQTIEFPRVLRDRINEAFKNAKLATIPVLATITQSEKGNTILTTTDQFKAEFLKKNELVWKEFFTFQNSIQDSFWERVIVHDIPIRDFNHELGMQALKEEIQTFNSGLSFLGSPKWITPREKREYQLSGSVILTFQSKEAAQALLRNKKIQVAGIQARIEKFQEKKPSFQCLKCLKFGHKSCPTQRCIFCAENHRKTEHKCQKCGVLGGKCEHLTPKCLNCGQRHWADSPECELFRNLQPRSLRGNPGRSGPNPL